MNEVRYEVRLQPGYYMVIEHHPSFGLRPRVVCRDRSCSCGRRNCPHVKAVEEYLLAGGDRAGDAPEPEPRAFPERMAECPVCGRQVVYGKHRWSDSDIWSCEDPSHYWMWRVEQNDGVVRRFLTGERPTGLEAVDNMSAEEYEKWLESLSTGRQPSP